MHVLDPQLACNERAERIGKTGLGLADRLDFRAGQNQTGRVRVNELVVETGLLVLYVDALGAVSRFC